MKIRAIALASAALFLLAGPASAGEGWYLGLGGGWDQINQVRLTDPAVTPTTGSLKSNGGAIAIGTLGYKLPMFPVRLEVEAGYDWHSIKSFESGGVQSNAKGQAHVGSGLFNVVYDIPVTDRLSFSLGGGAGAGNVHLKSSVGGAGLTDVNKTDFMWQGIGGVSYKMTPSLDLYVDYRYRDAQGHGTTNTLAGPVTSHNLTENTVLAGLRWYPWAAPPPPPPPEPPAPPPPTPPPTPPPATKTFIVFFDFNKADLTAEAQQVVSEAVKTAKETGAVRVLVTGHTDTVGSDSYNQGLSVRRAESVKDEMTREGMDGSQISIEGKSFHDPLVPTGPGVREPQNRRAVIDLGG